MLPQDHPARRHKLVATPGPTKSTWGLPLANGLLGAQVWQRDGALIISLDRTDVWDLSEIPEYSGDGYTNAALAALVEANDMAAIAERFEDPYKRAAPTKLPIGRIAISLNCGDDPFTLALDDAYVNVGEMANIYVDSNRQVGSITGKGPCPIFTVEAPAFGRPTAPIKASGLSVSSGGPEDLGYDEPIVLTGDQVSGFVQTLADGSAFCVRVEWRAHDDHWEALWTVSLDKNSQAASSAAQYTLAEAWKVPADQRRDNHEKWWATQWQTAWLALPDAVIERQWTLDAYKLIAAGRIDVPPIALQGPWTWDDGRLPPWKGDYHHDLNTQMTYWPTLTGNRFDAHRGFLDWLWDTRAACREWTRTFFEVDGLNVPMTADLANRQIGGWAPYTHAASTSAWLAHHFVQHWRYTADMDFLRERALPYLEEVCVFIDGVTRHPDGRRLLLNSSPEIGNNGREAWLDGWANYDLALFRAALSDCGELSRVIGDLAGSERWDKVLAELPDLAIDSDGGLAVAPNMALDQSHRHFSHAMAIHPLRLYAANDPIVAATMARLEQLGTSMWMGYSFSWIAAFWAYARNGEKAAQNLRLFSRGFNAPNSFHTNGDISGEGLTAFPFEAFTLEGNCAAMAATQDMLLQSRHDQIDVFPAIPVDWQDAEFLGLRTEGNVIVNAQRRAAKVVVTLISQADRTITVRIAGGNGQAIDLKAGQASTTTFDWP